MLSLLQRIVSRDRPELRPLFDAPTQLEAALRAHRYSGAEMTEAFAFALDADWWEVADILLKCRQAGRIDGNSVVRCENESRPTFVEYLAEHDRPLLMTQLLKACPAACDFEGHASAFLAENGRTDLVLKLSRTVPKKWREGVLHGSLDAAIAAGQVDTAKVLYRALPSDTLSPKNALTAAINSRNAQMVSTVLDWYAGSRIETEEHLIEASRGSSSVVQLLLDRCKFTQGAKDGALSTATRSANTQSAVLLLEAGADSNIEETRAFQDPSSNRAKTNNFLVLARRILDCGYHPNSFISLAQQLDISVPPPSMQATPGPWRRQPLVGISLEAAACAAALAPTADDTEQLFQALVQADVARLIHTPNLTPQKYREHLRAIVAELPLQHMTDVITEVTEAVFLPLLLGERHGDFPATTAAARNAATYAVITGKSTLDVCRFNLKWHKPGNKIPDELRPYKVRGEWHPLFEPEIFLSGDCSIRCLRSVSDLRAEGDVLKHCVGDGGYATSCLRGDCHILSVRKSGVPIATLEIIRSAHQSEIGDSDSGWWRVGQFHGHRNRSAPPAAETAWGEFRQRLVQGEIPLSRRYGSVQSDWSTRLLPGEAVIGYALANIHSVLPRILAHYDARFTVQRGTKGPCIRLLSEDVQYDLVTRLAAIKRTSPQ